MTKYVRFLLHGSPQNAEPSTLVEYSEGNSVVTRQTVDEAIRWFLNQFTDFSKVLIVREPTGGATIFYRE